MGDIERSEPPNALRECVHCGCRTTEQTCNCGHATRWPLEVDALRQQFEGAVEALEEIRTLPDTPGAWDRAYFQAKRIAREALVALNHASEQA
jgi:hypothetical protein